MNIVPQFLINEAKKILENITKEIFLENLSNLCDFIASPISSIFLFSKIKTLINKIYIKSIALIDEMFLNSNYRKQNFYKSTSNSRSIISIYGEFQFERNYYVCKENKKSGFYFIDILFGLEKYKNYDPVVRSILIDKSIYHNANSASNKYNLNLMNLEEYLKENNSQNIPRQTIYNWIKEWDIPKVEYEYLGSSKNLYVMVDEKWIHEQIRLNVLTEEEKKKRHYIMAKCFVSFTGAKTKNNRKTLLNRHIFLTSSSNPWKSFIEDIYNIYDFENIENIYLLSDSGIWILAGKSELKLFKNNKVILNTCEFHVKQYINRITRDKDKRKELSESIYQEKDKKKFIKIIDEIINNSKNKEKKEKYKKYILKHWKAILNMTDREIKSSMESHISHYIAGTFGSRPKGYSKRRIEKYLKLEEYKHNNVNIMDLYLQSHNKSSDEFTYKKEDVSFSIFEHNTSVLPIKSSINPLSIILNNIAYPQ